MSDMDIDDELLNLVVPNDEEGTDANRKKSKKTRTERYEKHLERSFKLRTILKWKYNYLEKNPYEYAKIKDFLKKSKAHPRSREFKKQFRLQMDEEYDLNMNLILKNLLTKELRHIEEIEENDSGIHGVANRASNASNSLTIHENPVKFLINYDREVERETNNINQLFSVYKQFPKCYPNLSEEKENFNRYLAIVKPEKPFEPDELENEFVKYWKLRVKTLRKKEIDNKKEEIRKKWEEFTSNADVGADLESLLISDDEDDDDCMIVENSG